MRDTKVWTVSVCRNMWQSASETMKHFLQQHGARHMDNVVLTHQGVASLGVTFITTPRALLFGKTDRLWNVFPPAGLGSRELDRVRHFAETILARKGEPFTLRMYRYYETRELVEFGMSVTSSRNGWVGIVSAGGPFDFGSGDGGGNVFRNCGIYLFVIFLVLHHPNWNSDHNADPLGFPSTPQPVDDPLQAKIARAIGSVTDFASLPPHLCSRPELVILNHVRERCRS